MHWHDEDIWIYGHHHWGYGHGWSSGGPLMMLGNLFWIALVIILVGMLVYWLLPRILPQEWYQQDIPPEQTSALEILRQRYARGEIDAMTFGEMRERLEASHSQDYQQAREMWMEEQYIRRRE
jgi:putative membrane protein